MSIGTLITILVSILIGWLAHHRLHVLILRMHLKFRLHMLAKHKEKIKNLNVKIRKLT